MIGIIKTSSQNLKSIINALDHLKIKSKLVFNLKELENCKKIILPGVGSFDPVVKSMKEIGLSSTMIKKVFREKHVLGICIGLQVLCDKSEEGNEEGFKLIKSEVKNLNKLNCKSPVPHVGFNNIVLKKKDKNLENIMKNKFYFTHSYGVNLANFNSEDFSNFGTTNYGEVSFISLVQYNKSIATQFHPEKSGKAGLSLIKYFYDS